MRSVIGLLLLLIIFAPAQIHAQNLAMKKRLDAVIEHAVTAKLTAPLKMKDTAFLAPDAGCHLRKE